MKSLLISFFLIQILTFIVSINLDTYYKEFISNNGYNLEEIQLQQKMVISYLFGISAQKIQMVKLYFFNMV